MAWPVSNPVQPAVGDPVTAGWGDQVAQALAVFGPSTSYTPAWTSSGTGPSLGNGTLSGFYWQFGKLVIGKLKLAIGSTTSGGTGNWYWSLPVTAISSVGYQEPIGDAVIKQAAASTATAVINSTTTLQILTNSGTIVGSTVPAAWSSGQSLYVQFQYESA